MSASRAARIRARSVMASVTSFTARPHQSPHGELVLDTLTHDIVGDGGENLRLDVLQREPVAGTRDGTLGDDRLASLLRLRLRLIVRLAAVEEVLTAPGVLDVFDADVDALPSDATTNLLREKQSLPSVASSRVYLPWEVSRMRARRKEGARATRTCLLTSTPTARGVTFHTMPVRPWYAR